MNTKTSMWFVPVWGLELAYFSWFEKHESSSPAGDPIAVCHAFHLPATIPQLSPVVKFFSHLGHFSPTLSIPPLGSTGNMGAHSLRGQGGMDREKGEKPAAPTTPPSHPPTPPPPPLFPFHWTEFNTNTIGHAGSLTMAQGGKVKSYSRHAWVPRSGGNQQHPWLLCLNPPK